MSENNPQARNDNNENALQRQQAERYVDRRQQQHRRQVMGEIFELLLQVFLLCVLIAVTTKTKYDPAEEEMFDFKGDSNITTIGNATLNINQTIPMPPSPFVNKDWVSKGIITVIMLSVAFITIIILSFCLTRKPKAYHMSLTFFILFMIACTISMYQAIIMGAKIEVEQYWHRKIIMQDPKTNATIKTVYEDGTYFIKDFEVLGRMNNKGGLIPDDKFKGHFEPKPAFMVRYFGLIFLFIGIILALMMILMLMMFFCSTTAIKIQSRHVRNQTVEAAMRNVQIMNMMSKIPYANFILEEARDCPICLLQFTDEDQVIQLKCNPAHIYHYDCLNAYLGFENESGPIVKQCPMCRADIEVQDNPVLEF